MYPAYSMEGHGCLLVGSTCLLLSKKKKKLSGTGTVCSPCEVMKSYLSVPATLWYSRNPMGLILIAMLPEIVKKNNSYEIFRHLSL